MSFSVNCKSLDREALSQSITSEKLSKILFVMIKSFRLLITFQSNTDLNLCKLSNVRVKKLLFDTKCQSMNFVNFSSWLISEQSILF